MFLIFKITGNSVHISTWKSKGLSDESINLPVTSVTPFQLHPPSLNYLGVRPRIKVGGQCLKQDKVTFTCK